MTRMRRWITGAVLAALAMTACTAQGERSLERPAASGHVAGTSVSHARLDCAAPLKTKVVGEPVVPAGAVAARLCGGLVDNAGFNLAWPADTLRGPEVAQLVARLNRLAPYKQRPPCTVPGSPGFDLVLAYPDASRVWVHGDTSGSCANVAVRGGRVWTGADKILRGTLALIESRRSVAGPAASNRVARCPRKWNDVSYTAGAGPVRPGNPVTVTACRYRLDLDPGTITQSADGRLTRQVRVTNPKRLVREVADGSRVDPCGGVAYDLSRTQDVLLVRDSYGDVQVVSTTLCWANELSGQRRYPGQALARRVAALLS